MALRHQNIGKAVAVNLSCRTGRSREDLEQIEMVGNVLSACLHRANGEVQHFLRDRGLLVMVTSVVRCCSSGAAN